MQTVRNIVTSLAEDAANNCQSASAKQGHVSPLLLTQCRQRLAGVVPTFAAGAFS